MTRYTWMLVLILTGFFIFGVLTTNWVRAEDRQYSCADKGMVFYLWATIRDGGVSREEADKQLDKRYEGAKFDRFYFASRIAIPIVWKYREIPPAEIKQLFMKNCKKDLI